MGTMQVDHAVTVQVMNSCVVKAQQVFKFGSSDWIGTICYLRWLL